MSESSLHHGQPSSDYSNGYHSRESSHRYDQKSEYDDYPGGYGDPTAVGERRGGGYGGFDDAAQPAHLDDQQSRSGAQSTAGFANGGWREEGQQEDREGSGQSRGSDDGTRRAVYGQGSRQIEG